MKLFFSALALILALQLQAQMPVLDNITINYNDLSKEAQKAIKPSMEGLCGCLDEHEDALKSAIDIMNMVLDKDNVSTEEITNTFMASEEGMDKFQKCMDMVKPDSEADEIMKKETKKFAKKLEKDELSVTFALIDAGLSKHCKKGDAGLFMDFFRTTIKLQAKMMESMNDLDLELEETNDED